MFMPSETDKARMEASDQPQRDLREISLLWASPDRASSLATMHAELFSPPWDQKAIQALLEHPFAASLVAIAGQTREPAGFIIGQIPGDEAEILSVGVVGSWQRSGLGRRLVEGLIRAAQRAEARRIFLEVAVDNEAALRLYQALDFQRVGKRPRYYQRGAGVAVDAYILAHEF